ncbi:MAG TPA: TVP38/TMEM64 family protein [Beijerinckiaceae bacterium]
MSEAEPSDRAGLLAWLGMGAVVVVTGLAWAFLPLQDWIRDFVGLMQSMGIWGVLAFGALYLVAIVVLAPSSIFSIAAGLAFGWWGILFVVVTATLGAATAFLIGRYLARDRVARMLDKRPRLKAVARAIDAEGWRVVALIRLSPPIPFAVTNYVFGVSNVGFWPFVATTALGILPATVVYVNLGSMGQTASRGGSVTVWEWALLVVGIIATVLAGVLVTRKARALLDEAGQARPA